MIKLPTIREIDERMYLDDVFPRIRKILCCIKTSQIAKYDKLIQYCSADGQLDDKKIKKLVVGKFSDLNDIIDYVGEIRENSEESFEKAYKNFTNRELGQTWARTIGVTVCPYCNRSYVFTSEETGTRPQYDHFFPKSKYPYLALSLYNLIPCCSICNGLKRDVDTHESPFIYPYDEGYGNEAVFKVTSDTANFVDQWLGSALDYRIQIRYAEGLAEETRHRIECSAKCLKIEELYSQHSDYVRDILRTSYIYSDVYFEELVAAYPYFFSDKRDAKNLVFFNYLQENDWGKRVLAKLTHDIAEEVE